MNPELFFHDEDDWQVLLSFLPPNWKEKARELGALVLRSLNNCTNIASTYGGNHETVATN